jgi:uncharacterized membrane protein
LRARIRRETLLPSGFAFQIVLRADCTSPNTPKAVTIRVTMPMTVARMAEDSIPWRWRNRARLSWRRGKRSLYRMGLAGRIAVIVMLVVLAQRADAQPAPAPPDPAPSIWVYSLYKTITYETAANLADVPLYSTVLVGAQAGALLFNSVNVVTAAAAYYSYEVVWDLYGPQITTKPSNAVKVEIEKTLLYRVVSSARNVVLAYALTGSPSVTIGFLAISNAIDTVVYVGNEYAWYRYGPPVATVWGK